MIQTMQVYFFTVCTPPIIALRVELVFNGFNTALCCFNDEFRLRYVVYHLRSVLCCTVALLYLLCAGVLTVLVGKTRSREEGCPRPVG